MATDDRPAWDWDQSFDASFVDAASVREEAAHVRAARARRTSRAHARAVRSRGRTSVGTASRTGRALVSVTVTACVLAAALLVGPERLLAGAALGSVGAGAPLVPRPPDAQETRLLPAVQAPPGEGGYDVMWESDGRPVGFDPCRPVHWVMRREGAPAGAATALGEAFDALSAATGVLFVFDGLTDEPYDPRRAAVQPERYGRRYAPVLVVWSDEGEVPGLAGGVAGFAGPLAVDPDGRGLRLVTGAVVLDAPQVGAVPAGSGGRHGVLLHELAHLVGLEHVDDPADTMHEASAPDGGYTPGAQRGLAAVGGGRCF